MDAVLRDLRYACGRSAVLRDSPPRRCCRSRSVSARRAPSSASRARCCCDLCRIRSPIVWPSCGTDRPASASPRTGSRPRSMSTSDTAPRLRRSSRSRSAANYNLTGDGEPERDRHDPRFVEPAAAARSARGPRPPVRPGGRRAGRNRNGCAEPRDLAPTLRRRSVGRRADADAERSALRDRRRAAPRRSRCRARSCRRSAAPRTRRSSCRCRSRADAARSRNREDYNIIGRLKPGVRAASAGGDGSRSRRGCAPSIPTSTRRTAA